MRAPNSPSDGDVDAPSKEYRLQEYSALRGEIIQRMGLQQQLILALLVAAGTFYGFGVKDKSITLLLVFPMLALFMAYSWNSNDLRIGQIGQYIRERIEGDPSLGGRTGWEHYLDSVAVSREIGRLALLSGLSLIVCTQVIALILAVAVVLLPPPTAVGATEPRTVLALANQFIADLVGTGAVTLVDVVLFALDVYVVWLTSRMPRSPRTESSRAALAAQV